MRIASFNLENFGSHPGDSEDFSARLAALRPQLQRLDADILCLQEVNAERVGTGGERALPALDQLLENSDYKDFHRASTHHADTRCLAEKHNLVVLSRWPIEASSQYFHDFVQRPVHAFMSAIPAQSSAHAVSWDRPVLHARIRLADDSCINVINLHLKAPLAAPVPGQKMGPFAWKSAAGWAEGYYLASLKRSGQAVEVRMLIDRLINDDPNGSILVLGDFNGEEREVPARIIAAELEDTSNGRLADHVLVSLEQNLPPSRRYTVIHRGRMVMFDHMFASRALLAKFLSFEIHNEALGDELVAYTAINDSPESYHAPTVASFRTG